ncbi:hypothetical protein EJ03DRAFT_187418 [Teratosphaeria nubilosa]|uniref:Uncharacterized protein n=1 Tax=Teratosphaeria nubilosa TaxID=161662 RepID=A0A6G1LIV8_9PEZI|nr:hypothetical protein EJ03DRAFT_187418 [Teratosphaeria nubilosa]
MASDQDRASGRMDSSEQSDEETMLLEEDLMRARERAGLTSPMYNMRILEALREVRYNHRSAASETQVQQSEELLERHAAAPVLDQNMSMKTAILNVGCEADYLVQALRKSRFRLPKLPPTLTSAMLALHNARVPDGGKVHLDKLYDQRLGDRERLYILMEHGIPRVFIKELLHLIGPADHPSQEQRVWQMREWHSETMRGPYRVDVIRPIFELKFEDAIEALQKRLRRQAREQYTNEHSLDERLERYELEWNSWRKGLTDALQGLQRSLGLEVKHRDSFIDSSDGDEVALPRLRVPEGIDQATEASLRERLKRTTVGASDLPVIRDGQPVMQIDEKTNQDKQYADNSRTLESRAIKPQELDFFDVPAIGELEAGIRLWDNHTAKVQRKDVTHGSQSDYLQDVEKRLDCTTEQAIGRKRPSEAYLKTLAQELKNLPSVHRRTVDAQTGDSTRLVDRSNRDPDGLKTRGSELADLELDASRLTAECDATDVVDLEQRIQGLGTHHSSNIDKSEACRSAPSEHNTPVKASALDNENQAAPAMTAEQKDSILHKAQRKMNRTWVDDFLEELRLESKAPDEKKSRAADAEDKTANVNGRETAKVKVYETPNRLIQEGVDDLYEASRVDEMAWKKHIRLKRAHGARVSMFG